MSLFDQNTELFDQNTEIFDQNMNIFIPHIFPNWANKNKIIKIFENLDIGIIDNIYFIKKNNKYNNTYYQAHIIFEQWIDSNQNRNIQEKIYKNNLSAKIVYDDPWYWILLKSNKSHNKLGFTPEIKTNSNIYNNFMHKIINIENFIKENRNLIQYNNNLINYNNDLINHNSKDIENLKYCLV